MNALPLLNIMTVQGMPIFQQLKLEEALFRAGSGNWCLINNGTQPAVVMGMLGKVEEDVEGGKLPVIRRFSGGGTVVVDEDTIFFTLILEGQDLQCPKTPSDLMAWSGQLLAPAFMPRKLHVEEQDYVLDGLKIGGNAQSINRRRVVHHTSFLWSWEKERMALLKIPKRQPKYRQNRPHEMFCNRLSRYFASKDELIESLMICLRAQFHCQDGDLVEIEDVMQRPHRKVVHQVK